MMAEKVKSAKKIAKMEEKALAMAVPAREKNLAVRGNIFEGKVTSAKASKTVTVERELVHYIAKYERYLKVKSKIKAHNPETINAKEGDIVKVGETRRISKTKNFLVLEIVKKA
ncbi:MAG: 30S ribosomal protein S17 [archaeon]|mgnify:CR=1 FL=1